MSSQVVLDSEPLLETPAGDLMTVRDLIDRLGSISPDRIRLHPTPGTAVEADVVRLNEGKVGLFELIDGTIVEKAMGIFESRLAIVLSWAIERYLESNPIALTFGADAMFRMAMGNIRLPDVSVVLRSRFPGGKLTRVAVGAVTVDLAVEVLSPSNTRKEIDQKRRELFASGTQLMWVVDPADRTVRCYYSVDEFVDLTEADSVDGGAVLPGFVFSIREWFAKAE